MTVVGFVLYGSLVLLPLWLQTLLGYPSLQAGIALAPRGMGSMLGMPFVGAVIGMTLGAVTLFMFSRLNLNAGYWDFFWPQFLQGLALSMLFVPLTTITMSPIPREQMGNATSLFNLMRNIGGSIGIAAVTTMDARFTQKFVNRLGENITQLDPAAMQMMEGLRQRFLASGAGPALANKQAAAAMFGMVQQQAAMIAFVQLFLLLAAIFVGMLPLLLIMKRPSKDTHVEMAH
jgi:DHA2 family multidrug resistance protein